MKLYILRHEDRVIDCSFFAPLTEKGIVNSSELKKVLEDENINVIYSSPFKRTLQTIFPYAKHSKNKINIEYGLSEIHHQDIIPRRAVGMELPNYLFKSYNGNKEYKSSINHDEIEYPEDFNSVKSRMKKVVGEVFKKHFKTNDNVILVTHQSLCNAALQLVNENSQEFKGKISEDTYNNYEKGKVSLIYENRDWVYKGIN